MCHRKAKKPTKTTAHEMTDIVSRSNMCISRAQHPGANKPAIIARLRELMMMGRVHPVDWMRRAARKCHAAE